MQMTQCRRPRIYYKTRKLNLRFIVELLSTHDIEAFSGRDILSKSKHHASNLGTSEDRHTEDSRSL